jgi:hypothetical protein
MMPAGSTMILLKAGMMHWHTDSQINNHVNDTDKPLRSEELKK